ncbi:MAG: hypothetical protein JWQ94_1617 [Tardiphaga sp.]|nr:hypothetical protein [Tardiphaga sp.]
MSSSRSLATSTRGYLAGFVDHISKPRLHACQTAIEDWIDVAASITTSK